jgi:hypothetical protein
MAQISLSQRGFTLVDNQWRNSHDKRLWLKDDDCALACDTDPSCKSITLYDDGSDNLRVCFLNTAKTVDNGPGTTNSGVSYKNVANYDKPASQAAIAKTRIIAKGFPNTSQHPASGQWGISRTPMDEGGRFAMTGSEYCSTGAWEYYRSPSGVQIDPRGWMGQNRTTCLATHQGAKACTQTMPGTVTNIRNTNRDGTGGPSQSDWSDVGLECSYSKMDPTWVSTNWPNLADYFNPSNVAIVKQQYCDNLTPAQLGSGQNNQRCHEFISSGTTTQDSTWARYVINNVTTPNWEMDIDRVNLALGECLAGGVDTDSLCTSKISGISTLRQFSPTLIDKLNEVTSDQRTSSQQINAIKTVVGGYCKNYPNRPECACYNAATLGVSGCRAGVPGCDDFLTYQHVLAEVTGNSPQEVSTRTIIGSINPRLNSRACVDADSGVGGILQYGPTPQGSTNNLNLCIPKIINSGVINAKTISENCTTVSGSGSGTGTGSGSGTGTFDWSSLDDTTKEAYAGIAAVLCSACSAIMFLVLLA